MGYYEKRINDEVAYWVDEWELDDYNVFKLDLDEDFDIDKLDFRLISEYVVNMWQKGTYIYCELNDIALEEYYYKKWRMWETERKERVREFWDSRGL